jgi:hypothetical protein
LRFAWLSNQSLWTDEITSLTTAQVPLERIVEASKWSNSLPTFFLLLRVVLGGATEDVEARARAISAVGGALSVPVFIGVVYLWRRQWRTALLAGLLLAVNPLQLWYSQEVRAYALMLLFGLLTLFFYELARERGSVGWWVGYVLCALAAIALHKTALVFPVACAIWHGWVTVRERKGFSRLLIHAVVLVSAVLFLMPKANPPPPEFNRNSSVLEIGYAFMTYLGGYSFGPSLTEIQTHGGLGAVSHHKVQVGILVAVWLLVGLTSVSALRRRPHAPSSLLASSPGGGPKRIREFSGKELSLFVLPIGIVAVAAVFSGFPFNVRYTLPGLLGFLALAAVLSRTSQVWLSRLAMTGLLATSFWADSQWFFDAAYRKADSRAVARWLVQNQDHVKSWTVLPDYLARSISWYLKAHPEVAARFQPPQQGNHAEFPPVPDVLIIGRRHHIQHPDDLIKAYRSVAGDTRTITSFSGYELYVRDSAR